MNHRTHNAEHRRETDSYTAAVALYGREAIKALKAGEINAAYKEGYRYCERCARFYLADYWQSEIGEGLDHEFCCAFCAEAFNRNQEEIEMKKDNRQSGFGFSDFELFAAESAELVNAGASNNQTEPCRPEGCEHSDEEHEAFDAGVRDGENNVDVFDNPYKESSLQEAWLSGHSVGVMNREVI